MTPNIWLIKKGKVGFSFFYLCVIPGKGKTFAKYGLENKN